MKIRIWIIAAAVAGAFIFSSCGDYAGKEKTHPLFVKASSCKNSGDYKEAARYYEEFVLICPRSALVHYELASIYGDNLGDPLSAIYHYRRYLFLSGGKTQDADDIRNMITASEKKLFSDLSKKYQSTELVKALEDLKKERERTLKWSVYAKQLRELYNEVRLQNEDMKKQITSGKVVRIRKRAEPPAGTVQTQEQKKDTPEPDAAKTAEQKKKTEAPTPEPVSTAPKQTKYIVKKNDTLSKISREVYGNSKYYRLILKANRDRLPPDMRLRIGMELIIPQLPAPAKQ